jgi:hypothetical protein
VKLRCSLPCQLDSVQLFTPIDKFLDSIRGNPGIQQDFLE